jgi:hypothetical protein
MKLSAWTAAALALAFATPSLDDLRHRVLVIDRATKRTDWMDIDVLRDWQRAPAR